MKRFLCFAFAILLPLSSALCEVHLQQPPQSWEELPLLRLTAFAVGQGDALLLECGGEAMMVDGGPDPFREELKNALEARGITHFKYLLSTHYHDDHINGLYRLMQYGFTADEYLHPYSDFYVKKDKLESRTVKEAQKHGIPVRRVFDGDELTLGDARLTLYRYTEIENANAKSLMTRVVFGEASLLLCADIIGKTQVYFTQTLSAQELKADIIKVPHHGVTAMNSEFLTAVSPDFALITSNEKRVTTCANQLKGRGIPYLFSGDGVVVCETDGEDWYIYQLTDQAD